MKNFKLLLATTAILSTGLAMNVKADPTNATLDAKIGIVNKSSVSGGLIDFGVITTDPTSGDVAVLKVNSDGSVDESSTAEVVKNPSVTPIREYHPMSDSSYDFLSLYGAMDLETFLDAQLGENPTEDEIATQTNVYNFYHGIIGSGVTSEQLVAAGYTVNIQYDDMFPMRDSTGKACGIVEPSGLLYKVSREFGGASEYYIGGTFKLDPTYNPANASDYCTGSTTVTLVMESN